MSQNLAEDLFKRDLSEAEADQLEAEILKDPALAERLAGLAAGRWQAWGQPEPQVPASSATFKPKKDGRRKVLLSLAALLALGIGTYLLLKPEVQGQALGLAEADAYRDSGVSLPKDEPRAPISKAVPIPRAKPSLEVRALGLQGGQGSGHFSVQVRLPEATKAKVEVRSEQGEVMALLHQGRLGKGEHRFDWDGHSPSGRYRICLLAMGDELCRWVEIERK